MEIKRCFLLWFVLLVFVGVKGQIPDTITLIDCYRLVKVNAPLHASFQLNKQWVDVKEDKLSTTNLPQVSAYGKAWYQSDAMNISIPAIGLDGLGVDKFQYNAGINVDQKIYDGGMVALQKEIITLEGEIKDLETETKLYKLYELVNVYFFGIATLRKNIEALELKLDLLKTREKSVQSGVENGVVLPSEQERLDAEILDTQRQMKEAGLNMQKLENGLKMLLGTAYDSRLELALPEEVGVPGPIRRKEFELFEMNRHRIEALKTMQGKRYYPKLYAYGQAGYSYPGLNFFENQADGYYMVGAKLAWNIFDWGKGRKEKQLLDVNRENINISEEDFNRNLQLQIQNRLDEIDVLEELIKDDKEIVKSKENIEQASASALENGTITSADYIEDLDAVLLSRIAANNHFIRLMQARADLALKRGIDIDNPEIE